MVSTKFYPLDATYKVIEGRPAIHLYGRTIEGKQICVVDKTFQAYFYVIPEKDIKETITKIKVEKDGKHYHVTKVEEQQKNYWEKKTRVLKVYVNLPEGITLLKDLVRNLDGVKSIHEYDIPFARRYLLDRGITPMALTEVEGEPLTHKSKVPVIEGTKVVQSGQEMMNEPNILAVDIEVYNPLGKKVLAEKHPIVMLAIYGKNVQKVITWKRFETNNKDITFVDSEADLIERFKEYLEEISPDILVGYYSDGFDMPYIKARANKHKIKLDFGLDYAEMTLRGTKVKKAHITGIVHLDVFKFIKRVIGINLKTDTYTLDAVSKEILGAQKDDVDLEVFAAKWDANEDLEKYCVYNIQDSKLTHDLLVKVLPDLLELIKMVGLAPFDLSRMSYSQIVEAYIIKQAQSANELMPNRPGYNEQNRRLAYRIKGAFVFEPLPGLYKNIVIYDYRSLYPTIIAAHNISPGSLNCECCPEAKPVPIEGMNYRYCEKKRGFLSSIIEDLVMRRARVKEIAKQNPDDTFLAARSYALKVLANSFYGYLAFSAARWYCVECAESTTAWGRYYIKKVIGQANKEEFRVIYSDTDSIFLTLDNKTKKDAELFAEKVNKELPGLMELDFEGFYKSGIFVAVKVGEGGAKKRYALMDEQGKLKITGFETVRRNTSIIAKEVQQKVLEMVLREEDAKNAITYAKEIITQIRKNEMPIDKLVITTQLSKPIEEYENIGPHVAAAKRMKDRGDDVVPGIFIKFVVVKGVGKIRDNVRLPDEITQKDYDPDYYIKNQIIPVVEKIFSVFGYTKDELVAEKEQSKLGAFIK